VAVLKAIIPQIPQDFADVFYKFSKLKSA